MEGEVLSCALGGQCLAAVEPETGQVCGAVKRLHYGPEQGHHLDIVHEEQGMLWREGSKAGPQVSGSRDPEDSHRTPSWPALRSPRPLPPQPLPTGQQLRGRKV